MRRERSFGTQWTEVGSQHPAYIRLGYPKLPRDPRRFDSRLKPQPYWQTVERLLADRGVDHVACLLAYALADLDKAQGKA
jgi:hypothetical protein